MKRLWHRIEHWMGWNTGRVETWWQGRELWVGHRCGGCGMMQHANQVPPHIVHPEEYIR